MYKFFKSSVSERLNRAFATAAFSTVSRPSRRGETFALAITDGEAQFPYIFAEGRMRDLKDVADNICQGIRVESRRRGFRIFWWDAPMRELERIGELCAPFVPDLEPAATRLLWRAENLREARASGYPDRATPDGLYLGPSILAKLRAGTYMEQGDY